MLRDAQQLVGQARREQQTHYLVMELPWQDPAETQLPPSMPAPPTRRCWPQSLPQRVLAPRGRQLHCWLSGS